MLPKTGPDFMHDRSMRPTFLCAGFFLLTSLLFADTLGYLQQKFNSINFEKGKWSRTDKASCYVYAAKESGAFVEIMRFGTSNLVSFRATKDGLTVTVCGSTAALEEGFEPRTKP
jgi:hypothetical protein